MAGREDMPNSLPNSRPSEGETRNSKSEIRRKIETRNPSCSRLGAVFGFRISDFIRVSLRPFKIESNLASIVHRAARAAAFKCGTITWFLKYNTALTTPRAKAVR